MLLIENFRLSEPCRLTFMWNSLPASETVNLQFRLLLVEDDRRDEPPFERR